MTFSCIIGIVLLLAFTEPCKADIPGGEIWCYWNHTIGEVWAELHIVRNNSQVTTVDFLDSRGNNEFDTMMQPGCQWEGTGTDLDPWRKMVSFDFRDNQATVGVDPCGIQTRAVGEEYYWLAHSAQESMVFQEGDYLFEFTCNISHHLPTNLSWGGDLQIYDVNKDIVPGGGLIKLRAFSGNNPIPINTIAIGNFFNLELSLQPDGISRPETDDNLAPWGAYCTRLYVEPPDKSRRVYMLDDDGCPRNDEPFLRPAWGFRGEQPDRNNQYQSYTGLIEAARFGKIASTSIVMVCEAKLCWIDGDGLCIDTCAKLSGTGRRKRSMTHRVRTTLYLTESADDFDQEGQKTDDEAIAVYVWAIIGGGAFVALVIIVVCCVLLMRGVRRRNRKYDHQHNSNTSSANSVYDRRY